MRPISRTFLGMNWVMLTFVFATYQHIFIAASYNPSFARRLKKKVTQWHEIPHEKLFDQFGISIAQSIFSHDQIYTEIQSLLNIPECKDKERLDVMLSLPPFNGFDGLRNELVTFAIPYKEELIKLWRDELSTATTPTLLELIDDFDQLFIHL